MRFYVCFFFLGGRGKYPDYPISDHPIWASYWGSMGILCGAAMPTMETLVR